MEDVLNNPVYQALISGDRSLSFGSENVKYFDERVSPFAGFEESYEEGFNELSALLPHDRVILHARPHTIKQLKGWQLLQEVRGLQLVWNPHNAFKEGPLDPVPLEEIHIGQMIQLTTLTKPGPFGPRTIDFGHYFGIFDNEQLVAMAGQRLHVQEYTEISAVCTHPDHLGKGYASALIQHQIALIRKHNKIPFLHVREDNRRAIELYQRVGFYIRGTMNFFILKNNKAILP